MKIKNLKYAIGVFALAIPISLLGGESKEKQLSNELASIESEITNLQMQEEEIQEELKKLESEKNSVSSEVLPEETEKTSINEKEENNRKIEIQEKSYQITQILDTNTVQIRITDTLTEEEFLNFLSLLQNFPEKLEYLSITSYLFDEQGGLSSYSKSTQEKFQNTINHFQELKDLSLIGLGIEDISFLSQNSNLESLSLSYNQITNMQALSNLENLKFLFLEGNSITDITPISNLIHLKDLNIQDNPISNLSALSYLTYLKKLNLKDCQFISDITPLENLSDLTSLTISNNQISNLDSLSKLTNLNYLDCSHNQISEIPDDWNFQNLKVLDLSNNQITDFKPLSNCIHLTYLNITENEGEIDLAFLKNYTSLHYLYLNLARVTNADSLENSKISQNPILTINGEVMLHGIEEIQNEQEKIFQK